jgi:hypothetical protein
MMVAIYAEDKKPTRPRRATPHFVGVGRPKKHMENKESNFDTKKWFSSTTLLKKRKQKHAEQKAEEKRPFYRKTQH